MSSNTVKDIPLPQVIPTMAFQGTNVTCSGILSEILSLTLYQAFYLTSLLTFNLTLYVASFPRNEGHVFLRSLLPASASPNVFQMVFCWDVQK